MQQNMKKDENKIAQDRMQLKEQEARLKRAYD